VAASSGCASASRIVSNSIAIEDWLKQWKYTPTHMHLSNSESFALDYMTAFNFDILPANLNSAMTYQDFAATGIINNCPIVFRLL
jgi:hypothetical protein